jgi:hypothetical protein
MAACAVAVRAPAAGARKPAAAPLQHPARPFHRAPLPVRRADPPPPQVASLLPTGIFALKLLVSAFAGVAITMGLWPDWKPVAPDSFEPGRLVTESPDTESPGTETPGTQSYPDGRETRVYRSVPRAARGLEEDDPGLDRGIPSNYPRRVKTVRFTPSAELAGLPGPTNALAGRRLRYLIGTSASGAGRDGEVTEVSYDTSEPAKRGISIAYCNLFDEKNTRRYGPYLKTSDTAAQYNEGQIDPRGPGWEKNLREQFERRKRQGFAYVELDNPDAYSVNDVIGAIDLAESYGLKVIAKNPLLLEHGATSYVAHPNVYGVIVERDAGSPDDMDALRRRAGKPDLPVWFVAFGSGRKWASKVASTAKHYRGMGVTYSSAGEYGNAIDILPPA